MTASPGTVPAIRTVNGFDICTECNHWTKSLKAERRTGGVIVRTCNCRCHPPTESITPEMLRTSAWHDTPAQESPQAGWDSP